MSAACLVLAPYSQLPPHQLAAQVFQRRIKGSLANVSVASKNLLRKHDVLAQAAKSVFICHSRLLCSGGPLHQVIQQIICTLLRNSTLPDRFLEVVAWWGQLCNTLLAP